MRRKDGCTYIWLTNTVTVVYCHRPGPVRITQSQTVQAFTEFPNRDPRTTNGYICKVYLTAYGAGYTPWVPTKFWVPQQDSVRRQPTFAGYPTGTHKVLGPPAGAHSLPYTGLAFAQLAVVDVTCRCLPWPVAGPVFIVGLPSKHTCTCIVGTARGSAQPLTETAGDLSTIYTVAGYSTVYNTLGCTARLCL